MNGLGSRLAFGSMLVALSTYWLSRVNATVKTPYLDEFFHVRQALVYWSHQWKVWDPKITTPPGLYLVSYIGLHLGRWIPTEHPIEQLRAHNVVGILLVFFTTIQLLQVVRKGANQLSIAHTALNICLFPPLFFFSGLYYTDVISVLVVLKAHEAFHNKQPILVLLYSLLSLWFRQTNIFWTAIYLGGQEAIRQLRSRQMSSKSTSAFASWPEVIDSSWNGSVVYDLPVHSAYLEDYLKLMISLALSAVRNIFGLIPALVPYLLTLGFFVSFVLWNGGVVLGDKDNHIASLHLPQMLYIWPYVTFFSWPIILPSLVSNSIALLPESIVNYLPVTVQNHGRGAGIRLWLLILSITLAILVIHYNTIIHPFTLADNRHYTFYVFRLLRRHTITKYVLAPVYVFFAWTSIGALSSRKTDNKAAARSTSASTFLLWLVTATLSLATAPLVEPRYYILPWIVWRLNVVSYSDSLTGAERTRDAKQSSTPKGNQRMNLDKIIDWMYYLALPAESAWHLVVNGVTGWIFLNRGFTWPNEPGETMRFMW